MASPLPINTMVTMLMFVIIICSVAMSIDIIIVIIVVLMRTVIIINVFVTNMIILNSLVWTVRGVEAFNTRTCACVQVLCLTQAHWLTYPWPPAAPHGCSAK